MNLGIEEPLPFFSRCRKLVANRLFRDAEGQPIFLNPANAVNKFAAIVSEKYCWEDRPALSLQCDGSVHFPICFVGKNTSERQHS